MKKLPYYLRANDIDGGFEEAWQRVMGLYDHPSATTTGLDSGDINTIVTYVQKAMSIFPGSHMYPYL